MKFIQVATLQGNQIADNCLDGDSFGELALLNNKMRSATIK